MSRDLMTAAEEEGEEGTTMLAAVGVAVATKEIDSLLLL